MSWTGDWTDWAGDNPVEAEKQLAEERRRQERWEEHKRLAERSNIPDRDGHDSAAMYAKERRDEPNCGGNCAHDDVDNQGVCVDCGIEVEGWEPDEQQLDQHHGTSVAA